MANKPAIFLNKTALDITDKEKIEAERLRPVDRLEEDELRVWDRIAPLLALHGYLNDLYLDTLVEYCRVVCKIDDLCKYLRKNKDTYQSDTRNGTQHKSRPEVGQLNECRRMLRSYVGDFGLTPAARKQLNAVQLDLFDDDEINPFLDIERSYSPSARHLQ